VTATTRQWPQLGDRLSVPRYHEARTALYSGEDPGILITKRALCDGATHKAGVAKVLHLATYFLVAQRAALRSAV